MFTNCIFRAVVLNFRRRTPIEVNVEHPRGPIDECAERRDTSNLTIALILGYVRARLGDEGVGTLLRRADEQRPVAELQDEGRWSTQEQKIRLFEASAELMDDPEVARR